MLFISLGLITKLHIIPRNKMSDRESDTNDKEFPIFICPKCPSMAAVPSLTMIKIWSS